MKKISVTVLAFALAGALSATETRTEIVNATTPAEDAKANSDQVPDVYAVAGKFERIVVLRFKFQADLLAGLEHMIKEQHIQNAVILSAAGSVRSYHYHVVSNRTFPSKNLFVKNPEGPADLVGMSGYVMNGRLHPHIALADDTHMFGGHLEPGTTVFTFAIVTLGVLGDDLNLKHLDDKSYR